MSKGPLIAAALTANWIKLQASKYKLGASWSAGCDFSAAWPPSAGYTVDLMQEKGPDTRVCSNPSCLCPVSGQSAVGGEVGGQGHEVGAWFTPPGTGD